MPFFLSEERFLVAMFKKICIKPKRMLFRYTSSVSRARQQNASGPQWHVESPTRDTSEPRRYVESPAMGRRNPNGAHESPYLPPTLASKGST